MGYKLIITRQKNRIISALYDEKDMIQVNVDDTSRLSILGNIYVGKVKNIVKNINAAFVEIAEGVMCYLSLEENEHPIFCNVKNNDKINIGDEIIVQVSKEGVKTKAPVVTCNLNFTGKYVVLTHGKTMIGTSNKINQETEKTRLKNIVGEYKNPAYGFIIRTNSSGAREEFIRGEINTLVSLYQDIKEYGIHKSRFSLIYATPENYICEIRDGYSEQIDKIITDDKKIFEQIQDYLNSFQKEDLNKLQIYEDPLLSLSNLYSVDSRLENALREKVWLKSGGNLIIQPTEALTVIDVNTSKAIAGKKKAEETFLKINLEAAKEIAKQLRLRNISGIIIIDFINMEDNNNKAILMKELRILLSKDPIKTVVVDMTALDLVEVTRKKVRKPLLEQYNLRG
ncbi:ribonuclease G [Mobilisporobacter senegalensis]|uniref:Ribonuclease G n=1 Tax=Mobilisporobacter senegalensis TaxID=1329262 RepID=A0A3N1XSZ5_9FIRM|nr:ribonuclease E/G [Mobilisporobacter senegalensis]ROR29271.1 ribonuclease G [Mobilisporobacter senegalensis]